MQRIVVIMTKNELREIQHFIENLDNPDPTEFTDGMAVVESISTWLRDVYKKQGPNKLGDEYKEL